MPSDKKKLAASTRSTTRSPATTRRMAFRPAPSLGREGGGERAARPEIVCWPGGPGPAPSAGGFGLTGCELEVLRLLRQPGHRQQAVYLAQDGQGARAEHPGRARRSEAAAKVHVLRLLDPMH